jgi:hypothetical protein
MKVKLLVFILGQILLRPYECQIEIWLYPHQQRIRPTPNDLERIRIAKVLLLLNLNVFDHSTLINFKITHFDPEFAMVNKEVLVGLQPGF